MEPVRRSPCEIVILVFASLFAAGGISLICIGIIYAQSDSAEKQDLYFINNGSGYPLPDNTSSSPSKLTTSPVKTTAKQTTIKKQTNSPAKTTTATKSKTTKTATTKKTTTTTKKP